MGFRTLDEALSLSPFRRSTSFFVKGRFRVAASSYDWTESLWYEDNLTADLGDWNDSAHTSARELKNGSYTRNCIPFIDDSGGTKYLRLAFVGNMNHAADDFISMGDEGTRLQINGGGNPDIAATTDTGIAFHSSGDLVDGTHALKIQFRHDTSKTDTYQNVTVVLEAASNVVKVYIKYTSTSSSTASFPTVASTMSSPTATKWHVTYTPETNSWAYNAKGNFYWWAAYPGSQLQLNSTTDGIEKINTDWYVDGDSNDDIMWYFKTG